MDALKKERKVQRTAFTRAYTAFTHTFNDVNSSKNEKIVAFQFLEIKMADLDLVHASHNKTLFESDTLTDDEITKEIESDDAYKTNYIKAKLQMTDLLAPAPMDPIATVPTSTNSKKSIKLPTIELPKFNGNIREWLPFWSQFKNIHEDNAITREDKFQYLMQATVPGSRANDIVKGFPPTGENYEKVITCLKNRFGRDDLIVEFYIRELLGLVLQNAVKGSKRPSLASLYDKVESNIRSLDSLGVTTDKCAAMLYPLVESSLPEETLRAWQRSGQRETTDANGQRENKDRLTQLLAFLQSEVENEERIEMALTGFGLPAEHKQKGKVMDSPKNVASASVLFVSKEDKIFKCVFCKSDHESEKCESARKLNLDERKDILKRENACYNCLKRGHISKKCRIKAKCDWCSGRHVILMCSRFGCKQNDDRHGREVKSVDSVKTAPVENNLTTVSEYPFVCLQTLRVRLYSQTKERMARVVIDTGSQRSYIRTEVAKALGYVSCGEQEIIHSLFGGVKSGKEKHDIFLIRMKNPDNTYACNFAVMTQDTICDNVSSIKYDTWMDELRINNITLSDVSSNDGPIDVLIGADVAGKLMTGKKHTLKNDLTAFETYLGWTVMGKLPKQSDSVTMLTTMFVKEANLSDLWRLDVIGITDPIEKLDKTVRDEKTREFLIKTAKLNPDGRYEVRLPWVEDHAPVSSNYDISLNRLTSTIKKLKKQSLYEAYNDIFNSWLDEGIIEKVPTSEVNEQSHYLPHRPVLKEYSTTKIRPVFDASACKDGYPSLNHCLEKGPNLIELVPSTLNRFREGEIGVVSDIKKAFLQIAIHEMDRDFLRFIWIVEEKIIVFRHCRVVFGLACSPFLLAAIIELHLLAALETNKRNTKIEWSRETVQKLKNSFYVDNCVTSVNSEKELNTFIRESTAVMTSGGFELRGWESSRDSTEKESTMVLGMLWNRQKDTISINPTFRENIIPKIVTKRVILSVAHKIFDPIGITCPVSLQPKLILQTLWEKKINWDIEIQGQEKDEFSHWLNDLHLLSELEIPRKLIQGNLTLHVFGDASGLAYAAAVFARVEQDNIVSVQLLSAKSRLAPKKATIPRLELMAANIAARLGTTVAQSLTREVLRVNYWTDSTTVLAWINRDLQWGTFVWNRIKEIRSLSKLDQWRYIPGEFNPADLPSRGCSPSYLVQSKWWLGPDWLYKPEVEWPTSKQRVDEEEVRRECKKAALAQMVNVESRGFKPSELFSSYTKLIRFSAWVFRFLRNRRLEVAKRKALQSEGHEGKFPVIEYTKSTERRRLYLTLKEIRAAETRLFKHLQTNMFVNSNKDKLSSFKTFLNEDGLYVLKTKISNREDDPAFLNPIIFDNNSEIVKMLVRETHESLGHVGALIIISNLRERFWIISLRKIIRSIMLDCVVCRKQKAKRMESETPPLPLNRVRDATVFEMLGIDFAGPLFLREGGKAWICVFTCAVYRAVHFELTTSLDIEGFVECLRRFVSKFGRPSVIYCDNGTNFLGTRNAFNRLDWQKIIKYSSAVQIEWLFNPPAAPWWGGWWERLIGVLKNILRKVLGKASLSYENLTTVLCDAQAIINSRPLTYISEDPNDPKPLTPAIFLHEIREIGVPDCDMLYHSKLNGKLKYRQKIITDLRARFRTEYLSQLVLKGGKKETREIKIGDVVLIGDDTHKRIDWPLARVMDMIPGRDGNCRVFILKTQKGTLKRPIQRLYPLEISHKTGELAENLRKKAKDVNIGKNKHCQKKNCTALEKDCNTKNKEPAAVTTRYGRTIKKPKHFIQ